MAVRLRPLACMPQVGPDYQWADHAWQTFPSDARYRRCTRCGEVERVDTAAAKVKVKAAKPRDSRHAVYAVGGTLRLVNVSGRLRSHHRAAYLVFLEAPQLPDVPPGHMIPQVLPILTLAEGRVRLQELRTDINPPGAPYW